MREMQEKELENLLTRLERLVPALEASFRPAATAKKIAAFEKQAGALPDALRRLLAIHDGMESECWPLPQLLGIGQLHVDASEPEESRLINFANDPNGPYLCLDRDGRVVEVSHDGEGNLLLAPDLESFFARLVEAIEAGQIGGEAGPSYPSVLGSHRSIAFEAGQTEAKVDPGNARFWSISAAKPIPTKLSFELVENGKVTRKWTLESQLDKPRLDPFTKKVVPPRTEHVSFPKLKPVRIAQAARLRLAGAKLGFPVWISVQLLDRVEIWEPAAR